MREKKDDRRIKRTRMLLRTSLIELMAEKDISDITIRELVERVDVNRSTFYLHYPDIYGLLLDVEQTLTDEIAEVFTTYNDIASIDDCLPFFRSLFTVLENNKDACRVLMSGKPSYFIQDFNRKMDLALKSRLEHCLTEKSTISSNEYLFFKYGFLGLIRNWIMYDNSMSVESISSDAYRILLKLDKAAKVI